MAEFIAWLSRVFSGWKLWIVVPPWEIAVRVRLGKTATALQPGPHLRLPLLDHITNVNTRLRVTTCPPITVATETRGFIRQRKALAGYIIADPLLAMQRFNSPMSAVDSLLQSASLNATTEEEAAERLRRDVAPHGISVEFVRFVDNAEMRALRVVQGDWGVSSDGRGQHDGHRAEF